MAKLGVGFCGNLLKGFIVSASARPPRQFWLLVCVLVCLFEHGLCDIGRGLGTGHGLTVKTALVHVCGSSKSLTLTPNVIPFSVHLVEQFKFF